MQTSQQPTRELQNISNIIRNLTFAKKLRRRSVLTLAKDIAIVAAGIRVSHLVDVAFLNLEEASELLHELQTLPLCENLCIIHIGDEYTFVCHQRLLHDHTNGYADAQQLPYYVCIDEDLRSPTLQSACIPLATFIHDQLIPSVSRQESVLAINNVPACMISLTGWLLEYPVIYVQSGDQSSLEWRPATGNALSGVPLTVCTVRIGFGQERSHLHRMLSFSYPTALFTEDQRNILHDLVSATIKLRCESWSSGIYFDIMITQETLCRVAM